MGKLRPFVQKESYMPNKKWIPFVIGNGYTTVDGASGPAPEWDTAIGNPVSFNALTPWPLRKLKVAFSPVQSGSGDPSPDNVRPITGWDSLAVYHSGADTSNPQTISISLGQTIYSGYVDVISGVVTVDRVNWELGSKNWTKISGKTGVFVTTFPSPAPAIAGTDEVADMICSCYKVVLAADAYRETIPSSIAQGRQGIYAGYWILNDATNAGDIATFLRGQYLCYKLATPIPIQLTPQEVQSLLGENVLFSDANGDLTVEYRSN